MIYGPIQKLEKYGLPHIFFISTSAHFIGEYVIWLSQDELNSDWKNEM